MKSGIGGIGCSKDLSGRDTGNEGPVGSSRELMGTGCGRLFQTEEEQVKVAILVLDKMDLQWEVNGQRHTEEVHSREVL